MQETRGNVLNIRSASDAIAAFGLGQSLPLAPALWPPDPCTASTYRAVATPPDPCTASTYRAVAAPPDPCTASTYTNKGAATQPLSAASYDFLRAVRGR